MSEEEMIDIIKDFLELREIYSSDNMCKNFLSIYKDAIQSLLDLYNNEKEKNKKLEETKNKLVRYIAIKEGKDYEQVCREFEI